MSQSAGSGANQQLNSKRPRDLTEVPRTYANFAQSWTPLILLVLGVAALLAPGRPLIKEWAYAGFTFNLLGATASHVFAGDPFSETVRPAAVLLVGAVSYWLRPASRRLMLDGSSAAVAATR